MEHAPKFGETELRKAISGALEQMAIDDHQLIFMELGERAVERRIVSNQSTGALIGHGVIPRLKSRAARQPYLNDGIAISGSPRLRERGRPARDLRRSHGLTKRLGSSGTELRKPQLIAVSLAQGAVLLGKLPYDGAERLLVG